MPKKEVSMTHTPLSSVKHELLQKCVDFCIKHGFTEWSLRGLATEIGTSHRMLLYHFDSRENLIRMILENFRQRHIALFAADSEQVQTWDDFEDIIRRIWAGMSSRKSKDYMTTFFEIYAASLRELPASEAGDFLRDTMDDWLVPMSVILKRLGHSEQDSRSVAHLIVASLRGLSLVDLAGKRSESEQAFQLFLYALRKLADERVTA
jgi:AcrR family transcriptional regulator